MSSADIRVELIRDRSQIPLSADRWAALVERNETNTIFQTYEWFDAWWQAFGAEHSLYFLLLFRDADIIGFAPLMLSKVWGGFKQLQFIGTGNADYQDFILPEDKPAALRAICVFLTAQARDWRRAWLCNMPASSSTVRLLNDTSAAAGLHLVDEARVACPALRLDRDPQALRQLLAKYSIRRPFNWFSKRGKVCFRHLRSPAEIEALLPAFFDQHRRRLQSAGRASPFHDERKCEFFRRLGLRLNERGWLLFSVVELDGEPIAFHFGFDYRDRVIWYKPSFEVRHAEHSPGLLLIQQLIEDSLTLGRGEVDFTIGDEPFKERFANVHRVNHYFGAYHSRLQYLSAVAVRDARRMAGRFVRQARVVARKVFARGVAKA